MKNNKLISILFVLFISFIVFPSSISAAISIKHTSKWDTSSGLGLKNYNYNTYGYKSNPRNTNYIGQFTFNSGAGSLDGTPLFCVEPGVRFTADSIEYNYTTTSKPPSISDGYIWNVAGKENDLKKVLSCWDSNNNSIIATQSIVWELISGERARIDENKILNGDYKPYFANGSSYSDQVSTLYTITSKNVGGNLYNEYKAILRCAARFNIMPSFSYSLDSTARKNAKQLTNYDDASQVFTQTFSNSSSLASGLLKYYDVTTSDSRIKVTKTDNSITVSTSSEIDKNNPAKITLKYAYKDNGSRLNNHGDLVFYVKKAYQSLARGSMSKESYLYVYTGPKPKYQLRIRKTDDKGVPMKGITFDVYSDSNMTKKIGTTSQSDENGYSYLKGIQKIGKYYAKESTTPDGYVTNKQTAIIEVKPEHKEGTNNYATADKTFVNVPMHFDLSKKTIDSDGNIINIPDYTQANCTGTYIGGKFTVRSNGKYLHVKELSPGKYVLDEKSTNTEIRTCNGSFNIEGIKSGTYLVTEIEAPSGYQLPSNPSQEIVVKKGENTTAATMLNGVTGVVFTKVTENGELLDGGKYSLQVKKNGIYRDVLLKHEKGPIYTYVDGLKEEDEDATYILETTKGIINIKNLPPGEYRIVEKQAPDGYDIIAEKDSTAKFTISDKSTEGKQDYYQVKLVNQKSKVEGSYDSSELIVTITTGRKVINYTLIISGLVVLLVIAIIIRKKFKK